MRGHAMQESKAIQVNKWDQWLLDTLLATRKDGAASRARYRVLCAVRQARLWFSDPLVRYRLGEMTLLLPLSHELPLYRRDLPQYSMNLGRVVAAVQAKYRNLTMIDVGANVGDSVAVVRAHADAAILCVEGEDQFFELLRVNTGELEDLELEHAFVGCENDQVSAVHVARGTASIELGTGSGAGQLTTQSLREVINRHPRFAKSKVLKIDAEGFDCMIISCEASFLSQNKPVLFFEYHPPLCAAAGYNPFPVFLQLSEIGYGVVMIYENTGRYLLSVALSQWNVLEDIHHYFTKMGGFCDLAAFHAEDLDLAEDLRKAELGQRTNPPNNMRLKNAEKLAHAD